MAARRKSSRLENPKPTPPAMGLFRTLFFGNLSRTSPIRSERRTLHILHQNPNIFMVENFVNEKEIDHIIATLTHAKFEDSHTDNLAGEVIYDTSRTSTFTHLPFRKNDVIRRIESRATSIVNVTSDKIEPIQVVRYTQGQEFGLHHDSGSIDEEGRIQDVVPPRRDATFFVYLNDLPEGAGGETEFPLLGLKVRPRRGCALLFCNVLENGELDHRVIHRALPVLGDHWKLGMNIWILGQSGF